MRIGNGGNPVVGSNLHVHILSNVAVSDKPHGAKTNTNLDEIDKGFKKKKTDRFPSGSQHTACGAGGDHSAVIAHTSVR